MLLKYSQSHVILNVALLVRHEFLVDAFLMHVNTVLLAEVPVKQSHLLERTVGHRTQ